MSGPRFQQNLLIRVRFSSSKSGGPATPLRSIPQFPVPWPDFRLGCGALKVLRLRRRPFNRLRQNALDVGHDAEQKSNNQTK